MNDSFIFYRSFADALEMLPADQYKEIMVAIAHYALDGEVPELSGICMAVFTLIKPQIDANNKRRENGRENGRKGAEYGKLGGRPKNEVTIKPLENPQETPNAEKKPPNDNVNVNVNDNANVNDNVNVNENVNVNNKKHTTRKRVYVDDERLNTAIHNFVDHRQKMRKPMTDYAIQLFIKKLNDLSGSVDGQIQLIDYAISKGWQTVYPINDKPQNKMDAKLAEIDSWV